MDLAVYKNCGYIKNGVYIDTEGGVRPCCEFKHKLPLDVLTSWNNYKSEIEKLDIKSGCKYCIDLEEAGLNSHRLNYIHDILTIDIAVDNLCNLKCTTCSVSSSSNWISDAVKMNFIKPEDQKKYSRLAEGGEKKLEICKNIIQETTVPVRITFYGGEPVTNPSVINFINWMAELPNSSLIELGFITNGTTRILKLEYYFSKFRYISINVSIDSIEEKNDYLRYGSDWYSLSNNLMYYDSLSLAYKDRYCLNVFKTLSIMNVYYFYEYINWCNENLVNSKMHMVKLQGPEYYSLDLLSQENKSKIHSRNMDLLSGLTPKGIINLHNAINEYSSYVTTYLHDNRNVRKTLEILKKLDTIRNTNFENTFPEIFHMLNANE